jgi:hypothetical protein
MDQMMEMTPEQQVEQSYKAAMDSVNLLAAGKPADWFGTDADWADCVKRNVEHLQIQVGKGAEYYGDHDLKPFTDAIAANSK